MGWNISEYTDDEICEMYRAEMSLKEVSEVLGLSIALTREFLEDRGVMIRKGGESSPHRMSPELIKKQTIELRKFPGVKKEIDKRRKEYEAQYMKERWEPYRRGQWSVWEIVQAYEEDNISVKELAEMFGETVTRTREFLIENGVKIRRNKWRTQRVTRTLLSEERKKRAVEMAEAGTDLTTIANELSVGSLWLRRNFERWGVKVKEGEHSGGKNMK